MYFPYQLKIGTKLYFRIRVPSDLTGKIGLPELKRSLSSTDQKLVKLEILSFTFKAEQLFCLIRTGSISNAQISQYLSDNFPKKKKSSTRSSVMHVADAVRLFVQEKTQLGNWTSKTTEENKGIFNMFIELSGNCEITAVDRSMMIDIVDKLTKIPANFRKYPKYKDMCLSEAISLGDNIQMSIRSVNKYLNRINSLFLWSLRQGFINRNPCHGLSLKQPQNAYEEREAYDQGDLERLVVSLLHLPAENPERLWIPLIALYSGMRLNEICQLHLKDIIEVEGIICFNINADGEKRIKTMSSKRLVPVHPKLIALGLPIYIEKMNNKGEERLWPNLIYRRDGYIQLLVNWYYRHNRKYITKNPKRTFHSLRHTFADTLKQKAVNEGVISELLGHSNHSMTTGRYGKRYRPLVLLSVLEQLDFDLNLEGVKEWIALNG